MCIYTCISACVCISVDTCECMTVLHMYVCISACVHVYLCVYVCLWFACVPVVCMCVHKCVHVSPENLFRPLLFSGFSLMGISTERISLTTLFVLAAFCSPVSLHLALTTICDGFVYFFILLLFFGRRTA